VTCPQGEEDRESAEVAAGGRVCWGVIILLGCGHLVGDFYAVLLTPLIQDFRDAFALSVTAVTILVNVGSLTNSTLQPVAGHFLERFDQKRVFALGLVIAAVFLSCIGLAPGPVSLGALLALGGIGVALFHPSGAVLASRFAGSRKGLAMSVYANGGAVGIALAPLAVTLLLLAGNRHMSWIFMPFGLVAAVAIITIVPATASSTEPPKLPAWRSFFHPDSHSVWLVFISVVLRSLVVVSVGSFVLIYSTERGWSNSEGRFLLAAFLFSCVVGGIAGGYLSDLLERRRLMLGACFLGFLPLIAAWQVPYGAAAVLLAASGGILSLSTPVNIVVAQELRPNRASAMSGVMMGLAWSVSVLLLIPFGAIADLTSTATALRVSSVCLPVAGLFVLPLPKLPPLAQRQPSDQ
jgi:FSR family fosmidomycin resistance protein-like MFS transporter